jgi:hypothetical protein
MMRRGRDGGEQRSSKAAPSKAMELLNSYPTAEGWPHRKSDRRIMLKEFGFKWFFPLVMTMGGPSALPPALAKYKAELKNKLAENEGLFDFSDFADYSEQKPKRVKIDPKKELNNIVASQTGVEKSGIERYLSKEKSLYPVSAMRFRGYWFFWNGHHRLVEALLTGKPITVLYYDL